MNHIERVYASICHRQPDKIPQGELGIQENLIKILLGGEYKKGFSFDNLVKVIKLLKMDLVSSWIDSYKCTGKNEAGENIFEDGWGRIWVDNDLTTRIIKRPLKSIEDVHALSRPSISDCDFSFIRKYRRETNLFIVAQIGGPYGYGVDLLGFEDFLLATAGYKEKVKNLMKVIASFYGELGKKCVEEGAHMVIIGDDLAYNQGTFLSPDSLRELIFPFLAKEVEAIKTGSGIPVFLHSDGDLNGVIGDIIDCGFDGIHPLQPSAGMNIEIIKKQYGDKLCLWGNIDLDQLLPFGTEEEVKETVKGTIEVAGDGGGYILSSSNILTGNIPPKNILAMYNAAE